MRLPHVVVGLALLLGACGSAATGQGADVDADALAIATPSTIVVTAPTTKPIAAACEQLTELLVGADNFRIIDEEASIARLTAILQIIDSTYAAEYEQMLELRQGTEYGPDDDLSFFTATDEVTNDACQIPVLSAVDALVYSRPGSFCDLTAADDMVGTPEVSGCVAISLDFPDELPCFVVADGKSRSWGSAGYRAADCDTGEPVLWDFDKGLWSSEEFEAFFDDSEFREIEYELVDPCADIVLGGAVLELNEPRWVGDRIVGHSRCGVIGLDAGGTTIAWVVECGSADWASPYPGTSPDVDVAVCDGSYTGVRATDGKVLWQSRIEAPAQRVRTGPGHFVTFSEANDVAVRDLMTGEVLWTHRRLLDASITVGEQLLVTGDDAGLEAYDLNSGSTMWASYGFPTSDLAISGDVIFARGRNQYVYRFDAASGDFINASRSSDPERLPSSAITDITDDVVVLQATRDARHLSIYDVRSLDLLWTLEGSEVVFAAVGVDTLAVTRSNDSITTYDLLTGDELLTYDAAAYNRPLVHDGLVYYAVSARDGNILKSGPVR